MSELPSQSPETTPLNHESRGTMKWLIGATILSIILLFAFKLYYLPLQEEKYVEVLSFPTASPIPAPQENITHEFGESAGWKVYKASNDQFEIQYPSEIIPSVNSGPTSNAYRFQFIAKTQTTTKEYPDTDGYNVNVTVYKGNFIGTGADSLKQYDKNNCYGRSICSDLLEIDIGGQKAKTYTISTYYPSHGNHHEYIYFDSVESPYALTVTYAGNNSTLEKNKELAKKILSTLKFTPSIAIEKKVQYAYQVNFPIPDDWYVERGCGNKEIDLDNTCILMDGTSFDRNLSTIYSGGFIEIESKPGTNGVGKSQDYSKCEGSYPQTDDHKIQTLTCREIELNGFNIYYDEIANLQYKDFLATRVKVSKDGIIKHSLLVKYNSETKEKVLSYYNSFIKDFTLHQ